MAKKIVYKKKLSSSFVSFDSITLSRSITYLLIVMLAGSIFFLFRTYQDNIMSSNMFVPFMSLTVVAMALLVSLLFLVNPTKAKKK